jgi:hypothetical protein
VIASLVITVLLVSASQQQESRSITFEAPVPVEAVASIVAACTRCDWAVAGREAVALKLTLDGAYSQHVLLTRGAAPSEYRVLLGSLAAGTHRLTIERDAAKSAKDAGALMFRGIDVKTYDATAPEFPWLSRAPMLYARPGTVERFSDVPLLMYAEKDPPGPEKYQYQYTVIFTNEDGGTPTDRLMATWGRTTDIEFVYGVGRDGAKDEIQAAGHEVLPFRGTRTGSHPLLWVATDNNMVSDSGPAGFVRFAPAPTIVSLEHTSREAVMDANAWTYAVTAAEMVREGRIDAAAAAGTGRIPDPRRFAYFEACGDVRDATLSIDVGVRAADGTVAWLPSDRGDARFRIARGGCFRGGVPVPEGTDLAAIAGLRVHAYPRPPRQDEPPPPPGSGLVVLQQVNGVFMLDREFRPTRRTLEWTGTLNVPTDGSPTAVPTSTP